MHETRKLVTAKTNNIIANMATVWVPTNDDKKRKRNIFQQNIAVNIATELIDTSTH